jgi:hypothetical protein
MDLVLDNIKAGMPGISPTWGAFMFEACVVSLKRQEHNNLGTPLNVQGDYDIQVTLTWEDIFNEQINNAWHNQNEATEHGAECIAVLLALNLTDYTVIQRSTKYDGFDYWLGKTGDPLFQKKARLEISGIFNNNISEVNKRYKVKLTQTDQSDHVNLPAFVGIVEFSNPLAKFGKKS